MKISIKKHKLFLFSLIILFTFIITFVFTRLQRNEHEVKHNFTLAMIDDIVEEDFYEAVIYEIFNDYTAPTPIRKINDRHPIIFSKSPCIAYNHGFRTTATIDIEGLTLEIHFHWLVDVDAYNIYDAIQRYVEVFETMHAVFPVWWRENRITMFVDRNIFQSQRTRNPFSPLNGNFMMSEELFVNATNTLGYLTHLFFNSMFNQRMPAWVCVGMEAHIMGSNDVHFMCEDELQTWLAKNYFFGDYRFIRQFHTQETLANARNVAYTIIRRWFEAEKLPYQFNTRTNRYVFTEMLDDYLRLHFNHENDAESYIYFYYFGDIEISTSQGRYIFKGSGQWTMEWITDFANYADIGSQFLREFLLIDENRRRAVTHIYPRDIPMENYFGKPRAFSVNFLAFVRGGVSVMPKRARHIFIHELVHVYLSDLPHAPSWLEEGIATMVEIKWNQSAQNPTPVRHFNLLEIDNLAVEDSWWPPLPSVSTRQPESIFTTYTEAGSFVLFLYNNFGMESLMQFYRTSHFLTSSTIFFERAFGYTMEEVIYQWQLHLLSQATGFIDRRDGRWWRVCLEGALS